MIAAIGLLLMIIDVAFNKGNSFEELAFYGKVGAVIVLSCLGWMVVRWMIVPFVQWLGGLVK